MEIETTFLTNAIVTHKEEKYIVLESCNVSREMLVLRLSNHKSYHYLDGVFTPVNLDNDRKDGRYFVFGVIHNWVEGEIE